MSSFKQQLQGIVRDYRQAGHAWPASTEMIASWAIENRRWEAHRSLQIRQCAREIGRAMREEYITDEKGRRVRVKHPVTKKSGDSQATLWDDIRTAPRTHMEMSFMQRRMRVVGDCRQLKVDADSYNDAHANDLPIQIVFDFTDDLLELEAALAAAPPTRAEAPTPTSPPTRRPTLPSSIVPSRRYGRSPRVAPA
jgi:hypothetical protein